jgi:hypothetical protein
MARESMVRCYGENDMHEQPYKALLNREEAIRLASEIYGSQLDVLVDMVNYGSNLIPRAYHSSAKGITEVVVIGVLLKQIVAMLDAVEVIARQGISYAALLQTRAAFEASLYIDWILSTDSDNRAKHYLVANLREERQWAKQAIPGTTEQRDFVARFQSLSPDLPTTLSDLETDAKNHLAEVDSLLGRADFKPIDAAFEQCRKTSRKKYDPEWYKVLGKQSIGQIAKEVGRMPEYEIFYSRGSDVTHSGLYKDHVKFIRGGFRFKLIRHLSDSHDLLLCIMGIAIHTFGRVIDTYRPGEAPALSKKYVEDWRQAYLSINYVQSDI